MNRIIEDGERRILVQEARIERLRRDGHATQKAEEFLRQMLELRKLQLSMRETLEQIAEQQSSSDNVLKGL